MSEKTEYDNIIARYSLDAETHFVYSWSICRRRLSEEYESRRFIDGVKLHGIRRIV